MPISKLNWLLMAILLIHIFFSSAIADSGPKSFDEYIQTNKKPLKALYNPLSKGLLKLQYNVGKPAWIALDLTKTGAEGSLVGLKKGMWGMLAAAAGTMAKETFIEAVRTLLKNPQKVAKGIAVEHMKAAITGYDENYRLYKKGLASLSESERRQFLNNQLRVELYEEAKALYESARKDDRNPYSEDQISKAVAGIQTVVNNKKSLGYAILATDLFDAAARYGLPVEEYPPYQRFLDIQSERAKWYARIDTSSSSDLASLLTGGTVTSSKKTIDSASAPAENAQIAPSTPQRVPSLRLANVSPVQGPVWIEADGRVYGVKSEFDGTTFKDNYTAVNADGSPVTAIDDDTGQRLAWAYLMAKTSYLNSRNLDQMRIHRDSLAKVGTYNHQIQFLSKLQDKLTQTGVAGVAIYFGKVDSVIKLITDAAWDEFKSLVLSSPETAARGWGHACISASVERYERLIGFVAQWQKGNLGASAQRPLPFEKLHQAYADAVWVDCILLPSAELIVDAQTPTDTLSQLKRLFGEATESAVGSFAPVGKTKEKVEALFDLHEAAGALSEALPAFKQYNAKVDTNFEKWSRSQAGNGAQMPQTLMGLTLAKKPPTNVASVSDADCAERIIAPSEKHIIFDPIEKNPNSPALDSYIRELEMSQRQSATLIAQVSNTFVGYINSEGGKYKVSVSVRNKGPLYNQPFKIELLCTYNGFPAQSIGIQSLHMNSNITFAKRVYEIPWQGPGEYTLITRLHFRGQIVVAKINCYCLPVVKTDNLQGAGPESKRNRSIFKMTSEKYSINDNLNMVCQQTFGEGYRLADWNDIQKAFREGIPPDRIMAPGHAYVTNNGQSFWRSNRHYIASRNNHQPHSGYLSHDDIDNHLFDLGSWYKNYCALCISD